jgi:hypothetical protein
MGLAPSRSGENLGKSTVAKVPVPIVFTASASKLASVPVPREKVSRSNFTFVGGRNRGTANDVIRRKSEI